MLSQFNIESELSYAYLHAVASRAGFSCTHADRHLDSAGVDAQIQEDGRQLAAEKPAALRARFEQYWALLPMED